MKIKPPALQHRFSHQPILPVALPRLSITSLASLRPTAHKMTFSPPRRPHMANQTHRRSLPPYISLSNSNSTLRRQSILGGRDADMPRSRGGARRGQRGGRGRGRGSGAGTLSLKPDMARKGSGEGAGRPARRPRSHADGNSRPALENR